MASLSFTRRIKTSAGVLFDADQVVLRNPSGTAGIIRLDTGEVIVPAGTEMPKSAGDPHGVYRYVLTDALPNVTYVAYVRVVIGSSVYDAAVQNRVDSVLFSEADEPSLSATPLDELDIVRPGVQVVDGCPVLQRVQAFVIDEATAPVLEMTLRDRDGSPISLATSELSVSDSVSDSVSSPDVVISPYEVHVRVTEVTSEVEPQPDKVFSYGGEVHDPVGGIVRVRLDDRVTYQAGLYRLSWAIRKDGIIRRTFNSLLSVEPSLFGVGGTPRNGPRSPGCPTIKEIRAQIMDSGGAENTLLQDVEFSDDQILQAVLKPIQYFNEQPPYIGRLFGTHDFPYRSHWIDASIGYLHQFAAAHYRRNVLRPAAGGMQINDKDKETEYLRAAELYLNQWREFVQMIKLQLNSLSCVGSFGSGY